METLKKRMLVIGLFLTLMTLLLTSSWLCAEGPAGSATTSEAKQEKAAPANFPSLPKERISPIQPETVEKASQGFEKKLQEIGTEASSLFGSWARSDIVLGITWLNLMASLLALCLVVVVERMVRLWIGTRVSRLSSGKETVPWMALFLEALSKPLSLFILVYGIYGALSILLVQVQEKVGKDFLLGMAGKATDVVGSVAIIWLAYRLVALSDVRTTAWAARSRSRIDQLLVGIVGKSLRIAIILLGSIMVLQNFTGIQMGPLIASLGIGGLAIALAAKDSVANLLGTLTIIFDKPFQIGDQVIFDKYEGTVESVGFRSTRIRTADGHLLSIPNSKMIDSPLQNVARRPNIRWTTNVGISYDTPPEKVRRAVEILEDILRNHEGMKEDLPPQVFFTAFKDWSLNITVQAWYHPPVSSDYQAWVQKTCVAILERFDAEGIRFALPAQIVYLPKDDLKQLQLQILKGSQAEPDK